MHALVNDRDLERAAQENELLRTAARQQAIDAWQFLRKYVNGYSIVVVNSLQPNAQLNEFIDLMNVKARRYRDIYIGAPAKPGAGEAGVGDSAEEGEHAGGTGGNGGSSSGSGSTGGSDSTGSGSGSSTTEKYTVAWYLPNGNPIIWYELAPGEVLPETPQCPEGYYWHPYPSTMPNHDLDIIPEPIQG